MRSAGVCYRAHDPRWAFAPTSGEGARSKGGRFNPVGQDALYLALSIEGAVLEASHGFAHRIDPLTICSYDVDVSDITDLRDDAQRKLHGITLNQLGCAWALDRSEGREPASWVVARNLIAEGAAGILVPSFAHGARADRHHNLVLWRWSDQLPHQVNVIDPHRRLPRDQTSWR